TLPLLSPDSSFFAERPTVEVQTTPPGVSYISKAPAVSSRSLAEPPPLPEATTPLRAPKQAGAPVASFEFVVDVDVDESDGAKTNDLNEQMEMGATLPLEKIDSAMVVAFDPGDQYNLTGPALPRPRGNQPLLSLLLRGRSGRAQAR
ncbi:MAG: hypothetical protein KAI47_25995, partial [Deltaproteobacteria bacterium]|nr:hypothetical protein [Deltaproteobacteria bacterium]